MQKQFEELKRRYEEAADRHRDAYNQALGGLHVLEELMKPKPDALTEEVRTFCSLTMT